MILRVYAIWSQSKIILGILFFIYVPLVVVSFVWNGIYDNPNKTFSGMFPAKSEVPMRYLLSKWLSSISPVTIIQVLDWAYCSYSFSMTSSSMRYRAIPRFVLG